MGVDFNIARASGLLVKAKDMPENVKEFIEDNNLTFLRQDCYGTKAFVPYGLLCFVKPETIYWEKVGFTPFTFLGSGVYSQSEKVLGGANIPFVVKEEYSYNEEEVDVSQELKKLNIEGEVAEWFLANGKLGQYLISWFS